MKPKSEMQPLRRGQLNTLAQKGTVGIDTSAAIIQGNGTDLSNSKAIKGKAKRKFVSQKLALSLIDIADKYGTPEMKKMYWNVFHCQSKLYTVNGRTFGKYCKNRPCTVCSANRKADYINRYLPVISAWADPYFVTLTVKSISGHRLRAVMDSMISEFQAIVETYRKRAKRGKGIAMIGIRSLESNFNPQTQTYNPHFHCVVASKEMADILVNEWVKRAKPGKVVEWAQKSEPISNGLNVLIEVVKYGSKIFTEPDLKKKSRKSKEGNNHILYAAALNNIFHSMRGLRIFERFGFNLPKDAKPLPPGARVVSDYREWEYHSDSFDWIDNENGHGLTGYQPDGRLTHLLQNSIDISRE